MGYKKFHGTPTEFLKEAALCERRNTASFPHTVAGQLWILTSIPHSFPFMIYMHYTPYDSHTVKKHSWNFINSLKKHLVFLIPRCFLMNLNQKSALEGNANACIGLPSYFIITAKAFRDIRIEHAGWRQSVGAAKSKLCPSIAEVLIYAGRSAYYFEANMIYMTDLDLL